MKNKNFMSVDCYEKLGQSHLNSWLIQRRKGLAIGELDYNMYDCKVINGDDMDSFNVNLCVNNIKEVKEVKVVFRDYSKPAIKENKFVKESSFWFLSSKWVEKEIRVYPISFLSAISIELMDGTFYIVKIDAKEKYCLETEFDGNFYVLGSYNKWVVN